MGADNQVYETVVFTIPSLPPSMNSLYNIFFKLRRVELKPEARIWKSRMKEYVPVKVKPPKDVLISIDAVYYGDWWFKNGNLRRVDGPNLEKLLFDMICEKLGVDDSSVFSWSGIKRPDKFPDKSSDKSIDKSSDKSTGVDKSTLREKSGIEVTVKWIKPVK